MLVDFADHGISGGIAGSGPDASIPAVVGQDDFDLVGGEGIGRRPELDDELADVVDPRWVLSDFGVLDAELLRGGVVVGVGGVDAMVAPSIHHRVVDVHRVVGFDGYLRSHRPPGAQLSQ